MKTLFCYHVVTLKRFDEITQSIINVGNELLSNCDKIMVGVNVLTSPIDEVEDLFKNYNADIYDNQSNDWEFPTIKRMYDFICNSDDEWKICYCHSAGVHWAKRHNKINQCLEDRRDYLSYFNLTKYKDCLEALDEHDICGVDWSDFPEKHFSGNYWWATSEYIKSLEDPYDVRFKFDSPRHRMEFFIGSGNYKKKCFHDSGISVMEKHLHRYEKERYIS